MTPKRLQYLLTTLLIGSSGCVSMREIAVDHRQWLTWHPALQESLQKKVTLTLEAKPASQGSYVLSGTTQLPEGSRLAIAAIRYLKLEASDLESPEFPELDPAEGERASARAKSLLRRRALDPTYAILDYQQTEVHNGTWQAQLNLWQIASNGEYQESWQIHQQKLKLKFQPEAEIVFLATLIVDGAADQLQPVQNQLLEQQLSLNHTLIQTSREGEQYFQATQRRAAQLPTGKTTPSGKSLQDINGGWGERYLLVEQDPLPGILEFPSQRHTNSPGSPTEFIQ